MGASYLPPPRPFSGAAGATGAPGALLAGWGRGRGGSRCRNIVGPASVTLLLARPEKIVPEEGVQRGGGNQLPIPNSPLPPTRPHPLHRLKAQKVCALDGSGGGGRGGGEHPHHHRGIAAKNYNFQDPCLAQRIFFFQFGGLTRGKCCPFFLNNFGSFRFKSEQISLREIYFHFGGKCCPFFLNNFGSFRFKSEK